MSNKESNILVKYTVKEDDSDWMSSSVREDESFELRANSKKDIITFLTLITDLSINKEIMKELEEDDFEINADLSKVYTDSDTHGWVSTSYRLEIKYKP